MPLGFADVQPGHVDWFLSARAPRLATFELRRTLLYKRARRLAVILGEAEISMVDARESVNGTRH